MSLEELTKQEQNAVRECMLAILKGSEIEAPEFQTRLGIDRSHLQNVLASWPHLEDTENTRLAINNCMNEVVNGVYISPQNWERWFTMSREEVRAASEHWRSL